MTFDEQSQAVQTKLKHELQARGFERRFERLAAALIGRLLGVPVTVAKSGFQHGGDAGSTGEQGRRFRLECKKYADTTSLSDRELLGEIDQALATDEALEAWVLVATCAVPEQTRMTLLRKGEKEGLPVLVVDWRDDEVAPLAALCAFDPDTVASTFSSNAADLSRALCPVSDQAIETLRRSLQPWQTGLDSLRARSHEVLRKVWNSSDVSNAVLGQDAAGGAQLKRIKRVSVSKKLDEWWRGEMSNGAPAAVIGLEGVGKTWAVLDWLSSNADDLPIVLIAPSSAVAAVANVSETGAKRLLAALLYELTQVRDEAHWLRRMDHMLKRPPEEGPVIVLWLDGMNQEPSVDWLRLLKVLQGSTFASRIRVIATIRPHYFNERLSRLKSLTFRPDVVEVMAYDTAPGGELDQMLAFEGLTQRDLNPQLIELARVPRLFKIVVQLRERLRDAGTITVHRLLWEYGRDSFGERANRSFSEQDWWEWLQMLARNYRSGLRNFDLKSLSETTSRPDLSPREVYARLSEIIDGQFAPHSTGGEFQLSPVLVAHSLGLGLLSMLDSLKNPSHIKVETALTEWLDPITALDERSEVLRAAVSIQIDRSEPANSPVTPALVAAWLQGQNVSDEHRRELATLAPQLVHALLYTIEQSSTRSRSSARVWSMHALRSISRTNLAALDAIVASARRWVSVLSRYPMPIGSNPPEAEASRSRRLLTHIGTDTSGRLSVAGVELEVVDYADEVLPASIPALMEGYPLARAMPVAEAAAIVASIRLSHDSWDALRWLYLLNSTDPDDTAAGLRKLAEDVLKRPVEPGIHPNLPARISCLLLSLAGEDDDEDRIAKEDRVVEPGWDYQEMYLNDPSTSIFAPERRHVETVLRDRRLPAVRRAGRLSEHWLDPDVLAPSVFADELRKDLSDFPVEKLNLYRGRTSEDHNFEELAPALARCAPELLADLLHRKYGSFATCPPQSAYWKAYHATHHMLLAGAAEAAVAKALRTGGFGSVEPFDKCYASNRLLVLETKDLDVSDQFVAIIEADLEHILVQFDHTLRLPEPSDIDQLIDRYRYAPLKHRRDLLVLLSVHAEQHYFSDEAWRWVDAFTCPAEEHVRGPAFRTLAAADPIRFGQDLLVREWTWSPDADAWVNHYGSLALIHAGIDIPFANLAPRIAPWRLLEAVHTRGSDPNETAIAVAILDSILGVHADCDWGATLEIDRTRTSTFPFSYSIEPRTGDGDLHSVFDTEARQKSWQETLNIVAKRVEEARKAGASLHLADMAAEDFFAVLEASPHAFDHWIKGVEEMSSEFRRKVVLAEGAYLGLCEALLNQRPEDGVALWRALDCTLATRFIGAANVSDLLHMAFRVRDSAPVLELRQHLLDLTRCNSDQALFDLALAASYNGREDWLGRQIEADLSSSLNWIRMRGEVLAGFTTQHELLEGNAWPDGPITTNYEARRCKSARSRWRNACARHWWRCFLASEDPVGAYAAWTLFLKSVDRRGWVWMRQDIAEFQDDSPLFASKIAHVHVNMAEIKSVMNDSTKKSEDTFLTIRVNDHAPPWFSDQQ